MTDGQRASVEQASLEGMGGFNTPPRMPGSAAAAAAQPNPTTEFVILEQTLRDGVRQACRDLKAEMSAFCGSAVAQMVSATDANKAQMQMDIDQRLAAGMGPVGP